MIKLAALLLALYSVQTHVLTHEEANSRTDICWTFYNDTNSQKREKQYEEVTVHIKDPQGQNCMRGYFGIKGQPFCATEYAPICYENFVFHNVCHMRALGFYEANVCAEPHLVEGDENVRRHQTVRPVQLIYDFHKAQAHSN